MNDHKLVVRRAEEVLPALRDGVALLPGCRDRQSRPLLFIPSKDQTISGEAVRNLLLYLYEVTAEDVRDKGIVIVIDMRGKQPSSNMKSFLKAIDDLCNSAVVHSVLIIKPEKFWDNKKAQLSIGSSKVDVQWIAADQLIKFVDVTQVPKEIGGAYPYHHEEWLRTRLELERWIWKVTNILGGLEELRRMMCEADQRLVDVATAKRFIENHNVIREKILTLCPIETLHTEHNNISIMINNPHSGIHNPDLKAALPYTKNLIDSCVATKEKVYSVWKEEYDKLENVYQYKLYEQDAEEKLRWIKGHTLTLLKKMGDIGMNEVEANERLKEFDNIEKTVKNSDVTIDQLMNRSARLRSVGTPHRSKVNLTDQQIREEWERLKATLIKRRTIVTSAAAFFRCAGQYFSRYQTWLKRPGIDPIDVDARDDVKLEAAVKQHQDFWTNVESVYLDAVNMGSQLKQNLKMGGEAVEAQTMTATRLQELAKAHKHLYENWRENKVKIHSMLALTAFHTDTQRVFEWLNEHGDPYLKKNTRIGENQEQAKQLQRNHEQFRKIAENTYMNAQKLFEASRMISESGVADSERMARLLGDLEARLMNFRSKSDIRKFILEHSLLFHIHFNELTAWYSNMESKYGHRITSDDLNECEKAKEDWITENDATASAFATVMGEGTDLINELRAKQGLFEVDYTPTINRIIDLIKRLEDTNARFVNRWGTQRQILDISCSFASFIRDVKEVLIQIQNWEEDMVGMVSSPTFIDNAIRVKPFHEENFEKVKEAVQQIKNQSKEIIQALHGNQLTDMKMNNGALLTAVIQENTRTLQDAEKHVTQLAEQTSAKIDGALKFNQLRLFADEIIKKYESLERYMMTMGGIPDKLNDADKAVEEFKNFRNELEKNSLPKSQTCHHFFNTSGDLLASNLIPRVYIVQQNERVTNQWRRLCVLTEERHKLLQTALMYYKTTDNISPVLDQLEKLCSAPSHHACAQEMDLHEKAEYIAKELSKHEEWKEKFVKSFHYAQKTSDSFNKYIQRSGRSQREINERVNDVEQKKTALRLRQTKIFHMWTERKKCLESCQHFVLFEMSRKENSDWLEGEGRIQLAKFQGKSQSKEILLEEFSRFKIAVKEKRTTIQTLLNISKEVLHTAVDHRADVEKGMVQLRERFEQFSRSVAECETALRGGRPTGSKDELSLDRNSDHSVGEKIVAVNKEMKKMREPVEELIKTERDYVKFLQLCVEVYLREFDRAAANLPMALRGKRNEIFNNIEKIYDFHSQTFLAELLKYEHDPESIGCSFTFHVDWLYQLYTEYMLNKELQHKKLMDMSEWKDFFDPIQKKHGIESLDSLLIKPLQRITRYTLLMVAMTEAVARAEGIGNVEEMRESYEIVQSIPRRANDMMHLNSLEKDKLGMLGPFVMQDSLIVWEPKSFFKKGKERQVFLFEFYVVVAKKIEMSSKDIRYTPKGKPIPLNSITVVDHVDGDSCRFGLRVGSESSNDNRFDFKAKDEKDKISWVKRIRELLTGLLPLGGGAVNWETTSRGSQATRSSKISTSSGERLSRDGDSLSLEGQRYSIHSYGSNEGASDQWLISSDFDAQVDGQLTVRRGERVETLDHQSTDATDWMAVVIVDDSTRTGLVPCSILLPDQPSSSTDRPDTNNGSGNVVKRKSLRRIFANSSKEQKNNHSLTSTTIQEPSTVAASSNHPTEVPVIVSSAADSTTPIVDDEPLEGLPPPMEEFSLNPTAASHMNDEGTTEEGSVREEENDAPKADEKSPEEVARFKRHYVLMELVETEKDYVKDLTSVVEGYIANLEQMELPAELLGKDKIIFANIAQILEFHKTCFLKEIEKCLENYEAAGSAFVKYQRRLDALYVKYCQNKPKSDYLVSQDEFEVFFAETKAKLGHKVALCDLLIKPVQRIMKYQLLLKDILKFTERAKDSTVQLKKALDVMHVVPKACDDMMQVGRLQNFDGNLTAQGRLIHQGTLSIAETMGSNTQKAKDRRIFLFEQSAIIADHIPPKKEFGNPTYIFKNQMMVNKMQFQKNVSADDPLKFIIGSTDPAQPNFVAIAQTQEEKDEWVRKLDDMLDQQKRMLEQLVNPKKFMGGDDISGGLGGMSLGGSKAPPPRSPAAVKPSPKVESPKKEKSKLFGFGKKPSAKSPTSP